MMEFFSWIVKPLMMNIAALIISITVVAAPVQEPEVSIITDEIPGARVTHGLIKLTDALRARNISFEKTTSLDEALGKWLIVSGAASGEGAAARLLRKGNHAVPNTSEALTIWKTTWRKKSAWVISGYDDTGLMYGLLDVADRIGWGRDGKSPMIEVEEITEKPDVSERAVSIYTMNRAYWESRFYDEAYWGRYLDMLAQNRFNSLVLIFGYENGGFLAPPYPYFFNTEAFPEVRMVGITPQQQQRNLKALNHLIDMAHERGIRFTVGIWDHIYRGGVQGGGIPGTREAPAEPREGLVWGVTADNLIAYTKEALADFVRLVPALDGIQFRMHNESGLKKGEQLTFWSDVFRMMKETAPGLRLDLRAKELPEAVIQSALDIGLNFRITTKYWMEQMGMPYHPTKTNPEKSDIRHSYAYLLRYPRSYRIHWRLWNGGTSRILLWGNPEYVRRFAQSTHLYDGDGYEVNEPLATKMEAQPHDAKPFELLNPEHQYYDREFERYWHFFQVFGRIGYNPDTSPKVWNKEFEQRFGKAGPFIRNALHEASWILPRIITSSYPYKLFPTTRGWAEKQRLGDLPAFAHAEFSDLQQFATFDEEADIRINGGEIPKILPSANSAWFKEAASRVNELIVRAMKAAGSQKNKEFHSTITDLRILSNLALYHSRRIPAAVSYRIFERTQDVSALDDAIAHERSAIEAWRQIVAAAADVYTDDLRFGVCVANLCGHWKDELASLEKGLAELQQSRERFEGVKSTAGSITVTPPSEKLSSPSANYDARFQVSHVPVLRAPVNKPILITVKVTAPAGVKWVRLRYRSVNQDMKYETLEMLPDEHKDSYQVTVPEDHINPEYDFMYFIEIMDSKGRGKIFPDLEKETPYRIVQLIR